MSKITQSMHKADTQSSRHYPGHPESAALLRFQSEVIEVILPAFYWY